MTEFDNVAKLKLATLKTGQFVETGGYYTKGGGGAAKYLIVAPQAADGYGDHVLANGNVAVLQLKNGIYNLLEWGATDNIGVASVINAANGLPVYAPSGYGDYDITGDVVITAQAVNMTGDKGKTKFINGSFLADVDGLEVSLSCFEVDPSDTSKVAIDMGITNTNTILNYECQSLIIRNARRAINGNCEVKRGRFYNNQIYNIGGLGVAQTSGFLIGTGADIAVQSNDLRFSENTINGVLSSGTTEAHAFLISGNGISITHNEVKNVYNATGGNGGEAIYTNGENTVIDGNTIINGNNGQGAITCKGFDPSLPNNPKSKDVIVTNNTIDFPESTILTNRIGIGCYARSMLVRGNIIRNSSGGEAIHSVGQRAEHFITDNKIINCKATRAIQIDSEISSKHYKISNNEIINFDMTDKPTTNTVINFNIDGITENIEVSNNSFSFEEPNIAVSNLYLIGFTVESGEQAKNVTITGNSAIYPSTNTTNTSHVNLSSLSGALNYENVFISANSSDRAQGITTNSLAAFTKLTDMNNSWNFSSSFYTGSSYLGFKGTVVNNSNAAVGQPQGWACTVTGRPGTWVAMPNL